MAPDADEHADLAQEREALLARLPAIAYFTRPADFDRAAAVALDWRERYNRAYQFHYRAVLAAARDIVEETAEAARRLPELEAFNAVNAPSAVGPPVGQDATGRLRDAIESLATLPEGVDERSAQTGGVVLGRMPTAIGEARLASAAVIAALDVQRRRHARVSQPQSR